MPTDSAFGCQACFQGDAETTWKAMRNFPVVERLIGESHFSVTVLACPECGQRCIRIFTETVDWADGQDPQYWSVVPLTVQESEELIGQGEHVDRHLVEAMGSDRRYLQVDYPKGRDLRAFWANGHLMIGPHD
jgi:hypothetical protein